MLPRAVEITQQALVLVLVLSIPALLVGVVVGVIVGLFGAVTQITDASIAFLPKLVGVAGVIVVLGRWGGGLLLRFTAEMWRALPVLVQ